MRSTRDTSGNEQVVNAWSCSWARSILETLYAGLTRADSVQPVDLIFVMAGRMNRKQYGFELYRKGVAPKLVLSVGRFEVSKMLQTAFAFVDELVALRSVTPSNQRHFFVSLDRFGTRVELASVPQWNTYGEVVGLMGHLEREHPAKVMVVSTDIHLRRVAYTIRKMLRDRPVEFFYCPVLERDNLGKQSWWTRPDSRSYVFSELMKLAGYGLILSLPAWAAGRLMRLRGYTGSRPSRTH
jgi:hypothetical protein